MKRLASLFLLCVMLLSLTVLTGCHGSISSDAFAVPEEFDTSRSYELTFWAKNDTNRRQVDIYDKAVADFEALYPNIHITVRYYTDYSRIYNDVITNIATNTTPNVCISYPDNIATYLTGDNVVVELDELFADKRYGLGGSELRFDGVTRAELVPQFISECRIGGSTYAIPYMRSTEACYVNKTYVEALGYELPEILTWDFVWEVSEAAMAQNADGTFVINGQEVMIPFIYKSTDNMMIQMLRQLDAPYSTAEGDILLFNEQTKAVLETIAEHTRTRAFSTFKISSYPANFFNAGQCIFGIDSTAGSTWMGSEAPLLDIPADQLVSFETVVYPVPQFDTEHPQMISQGPSLCVFNKEDPQEVLASWLFAQYMLTNEVQIAYSETEGYVPVTTKALESAEYRDYLARAGEDNDMHYSVKLDSVNLFLSNLDNTFTTEVFNGSASLRDASSQMIENVCKSVRRKQTVDDAYYEKLFEEMNSLYHLDQVSAVGGSVRKDLGSLPSTAVVLLVSLGAAWCGIAAAFCYRSIKKKHNVKGEKP